MIFISFIFLSIFLTSLSVKAESELQKSQPKDSANGLFMFYKSYISPVDGDRCGMSPSCSSYGEEAFKKHGFFIGWIMTCDRLIRCGRDESRISEAVSQTDGRALTLDPVESNDFWWYDLNGSN
ncbi:MAG: membrane protein insertion efficiency factor YidD [Desulfamplus sp.]|nr:membrane protein insertion efficiency factor YidD [Desulfamplus sp.]